MSKTQCCAAECCGHKPEKGTYCLFHWKSLIELRRQQVREAKALLESRGYLVVKVDK